MIIDEITKGESTSIEFKEQLPEKSSKYMKTCEPSIFPDVYSITLDEKHVIVVDIQPGRQRPYYIKSKGITNGVYVRVSGTTRIADRSYIQELLLEDSHRYYDQLPANYDVTESEIEALCQNMHQVAVQNAVDKSLNVEIHPVTANILLSWGVLTEQNGKLRPTNAFALLSGNERYFPCKIQCGVFRGTTRSLLVGRQEFDGPLYKQVQNVYEYILSKIGIRTEIKGLYRMDTYEFPKESIREAIVNAVVHRSYLEPSNVTIFLYDDRLEITSPGGLLQTVTIERMKEGYSKIRNRALTYAFIYMNLIDQYGSGIPRILEAFKNSGLQEPQFVDMESDFRIVFLRSVLTDDVNRDANDANDANDDVNSNQDLKYQIYEELKKNPTITQQKLADTLSVSRPTINRAVKKLKEEQKIKREGNLRSGRWIVLK